MAAGEGGRVTRDIRGKRFHDNISLFNLEVYFQVGNADITTTDHLKLVHKLLQKYEWLIEKVLSDDDVTNVKVLPQLHTYIWGNKRGV